MRRFDVYALLPTLTVSVWSGQAASPQAVEIVPAEFRGAVQPQIAVASQGRAYVTFGKGQSIYCSAARGSDLLFGAPTEIATLPKLALGMRRGPRIAASDGAIVISAISHADGNLYSWISTNQGRTWSQAMQVNETETSAREGMHAMTGDSRGVAYLAWLDLRNGKTELWGSASTNHGKNWGANVLIYKSPDGHICECCSPSVAADAGGSVWAMWRNWLDGARDIYAAASLDGGGTFGAARKLGTGTWPLQACPMDGGHLTLTPAGKLLSVWRREGAIYAAGEDGVEKLLAAQGTQPVVAYAKGAVYYLWQRGSKVMLQNGSGPAEILADSAAFPSLAAGSEDSAPIAVWESTTNGLKTIMARKLE